jgi:hypothetical protein
MFQMLGILQTGCVTDDPAAKDVMYGSMTSITDGGSAMSDSSKKSIKDTIVGIETRFSLRRRRRRREVGSSSLSVEVYTVAQVSSSYRVPHRTVLGPFCFLAYGVPHRTVLGPLCLLDTDENCIDGVVYE